MDEYPPFDAQEARATLVDFACILHERRSQISELHGAGVSARLILNLYPFINAEYGQQIRDLMDVGLERQIRVNANASQPFGTVARHLPADERRLIRACTRQYDRELARVRAMASERNLGASVTAALEEREEAIYDVNFTLAILDCLSRQPFVEDISWMQGERVSLEAGLPLWRQMTQELLELLRKRSETLSRH